MKCDFTEVMLFLILFNLLIIFVYHRMTKVRDNAINSVNKFNNVSNVNNSNNSNNPNNSNKSNCSCGENCKENCKGKCNGNCQGQKPDQTKCLCQRQEGCKCQQSTVSKLSTNLDITQNGFHDKFFPNNNNFLGWRHRMRRDYSQNNIGVNPTFKGICTEFYLKNMEPTQPVRQFA